MPSDLRPRVLLSACLAAVVVLAGCTAQRPGRGTPAPAVQRAAAQDPTQLLRAAETGLGDLDGFEATGTLEQNGETIAVDLTVGFAGGHGTLSADGLNATFDYTSYGSAYGDDDPTGPSGLYVTAPTAWWKARGVAAADATRYDGQQVSVPRSSRIAVLSKLLTAKGLAAAVLDADVPDSATVLASPPVDGVDAWVIDFGRSRDTRITVQISGQQFPLRVTSPHETLSFGQFGKTPRATTPATIGLSLPG